ncbi:glycoside hydrolase family 7 protein [Xylariomycetidae sp. FL2044]|nr:glycoside hydrolase family 7 protein [Xylariomycetidae sp. FL2044]
MRRLLAAAPWLFLGRIAVSQGIGNPDTYPKLTTEKCTIAGGGYISGLNEELGPDPAACAANCVCDGAGYEANGMFAEGSTVTMNQYMTRDGVMTSIAPRVYLLDQTEENYELLYLKNQEITLDVDVSMLGCGMNGMLHLSEMSASGSRSDLNPAGARYANLDSRGSCCAEMDLWEANSRSTVFMPHVYSTSGVHACEGDQCGCLRTKPFTVTTQFMTDLNNATRGLLNEIRRLYAQDGRAIQNAAVASAYMPPGDSIGMFHCQAAGVTFEMLGGLRALGKSLDRGMVLVFSIWNDESKFMNWLDSGHYGPCSSTEGIPELIIKEHPDTRVTFGNVRWGDIGSTFSGGV